MVPQELSKASLGARGVASLDALSGRLEGQISRSILKDTLKRGLRRAPDTLGDKNATFATDCRTTP